MEYVFTFLEGIASFISPCLLPMIPIYIAYFAGKDEKNPNKALKNAVGFVCGFTTIFILLAIFASQLGKLISSNMQYIKIVFGAIIILFGLNYMELINIKFMNRINDVKANKENLNFIKSFLFGILFSVSWTPCIGTFLGSALLLVAKRTRNFKRNSSYDYLFYWFGNTVYFIGGINRKDKRIF